MAFDAGMTAAVAAELREKVLGGKIEKVYQPQRDEITLSLRGAEQNRRLLLSASGSCPRVGLSAAVRENPQSAPMFCMLLRKHLSGAVISGVVQPGFERVLRIDFETRDELGFACSRSLICEVMGKWSNIIFTDGEDKILGVLRPVDFSVSHKRQVLVGMKYELPPAQQDKCNPLSETQEGFMQRLAAAGDEPCDKFLLRTYQGISPLTAREISFLASLSADKPADACSPRLLWDAFNGVMERIRNEKFEPVLIAETDGTPVEYSFFPVKQYGLRAKCTPMPDFGALLDAYFEQKDRVARLRQRANDIFKLLLAAQNRLSRKLTVLHKELSDCDQMDAWRRAGDLITGNIYQLQRGMTSAELTDWEDEKQKTVRVALDSRLTPSQNAQKYYKKYNKAKTAQRVLTEQIESAQTELAYLDTVFDALTRAQTESDLAEIREELYESGYASRMKNQPKSKKKQYRPMEFVTDEGFRVLCGKNNLQNEYITHQLAQRHDWWFHVKNAPGSHVILCCEGKEPGEKSFTQAAMIAAYYAKRGEAKHIAVDYTQVYQLKKVPGARPGMVIYHSNYSAYVTPDEQAVLRLRIKE